MALKSQPTTLHPPKSWGAQNLQGRNKPAGWGPRGGASQPHHHSKPHPFNRPKDLGSREALQLTRVCDLGWLLLSLGPTTLYRKWL